VGPNPPFYYQVEYGSTVSVLWELPPTDPIRIAVKATGELEDYYVADDSSHPGIPTTTSAYCQAAILSSTYLITTANCGSPSLMTNLKATKRRFYVGGIPGHYSDKTETRYINPTPSSKVYEVDVDPVEQNFEVDPERATAGGPSAVDPLEQVRTGGCCLCPSRGKSTWAAKL
jgi:hypothetical protein